MAQTMLKLMRKMLSKHHTECRACLEDRAARSDEEDETLCERHKVKKEDFNLIAPLGRGKFGSVMLVQKKSSGKLYAMKFVEKASVLNQCHVRYLFSERSVLKRCKHPFIVKLDYAFQSDSRAFFVMEYLPGGDLAHYLDRCVGKRLSEAQARFYAAEIWTALQFLHDYGTIYRDLKPENILLDAEGHVCLSDFGLAKDFHDSGHEGENRTQSFVGSPYYVSPEVLRQLRYGKAVDWWAFGVLLFRMLCGRVPFDGQNRRQVFDLILHNRPDFTPYPWVSSAAIDLITKLLQKDEKARISGARVKAHRFFNGIDWASLPEKKSPPPEYMAKPPTAPICVTANGSNGGQAIPASLPFQLSTSKQKLFDGFTYIAGSLESSCAKSVTIQPFSQPRHGGNSSATIPMNGSSTSPMPTHLIHNTIRNANAPSAHHRESELSLKNETSTATEPNPTDDLEEDGIFADGLEE